MNSEEILKLENQLCFTIYACSREITKLYKPLLEPLGLTYPQYLAMLVLWEHSEISVKEMGVLLYLDSGTLTPMLKRMEENELIVRKRLSSDERVVIVSLTSKGEKLRESACNIPELLMKKATTDGTDVHTLQSRLQEMLIQVQQITK
ncbi:MarR family winged helix-turn-helix transcriptional regulator [Bacillus sp. FJAT-45350]|uniref:MarR family winged helix-turn-helix transcriptional regulator n=1 Tax=Bacillus sp. FJAT-45350 TaxID=2011014 RepID=UPI000BB90C51|nr:MarR family transcriptional regulator [Bacillus sp. FJAT-45350]